MADKLEDFMDDLFNDLNESVINDLLYFDKNRYWTINNIKTIFDAHKIGKRRFNELDLNVPSIDLITNKVYKIVIYGFKFGEKFPDLTSIHPSKIIYKGETDKIKKKTLYNILDKFNINSPNASLPWEVYESFRSTPYKDYEYPASYGLSDEECFNGILRILNDPIKILIIKYD